MKKTNYRPVIALSTASVAIFDDVGPPCSECIPIAYIDRLRDETFLALIARPARDMNRRLPIRTCCLYSDMMVSMAHNTNTNSRK